jgi:hypothetical protein
MIIVRLLSPGPWLVGTTKVYSGVGADIVMESISLIDPAKNETKAQACANAWLHQQSKQHVFSGAEGKSRSR